MSFDTAFEHWDRQWADPEKRVAWETADSRVLNWSRRLLEQGGTRALDLGCGVGRHALALAELGYRVDALDAAPQGLARAAETARDRGLDLSTVLAPMTDLPFSDGCFDYVVSWNVIYHGDETVVKTCLSEITRVLRPGGVYQGTMLSKRNGNFGVGDEISVDTWINNAVSDKAHPHYYCDAAKLVALLAPLNIWEMEDYEQKPHAFHWHVVAEKPFG